MKFIIKHEIKGRIRISLARKFHTVREADVLEQYLLGLDGVTAAKVYERTADAVIYYKEDREAVLVQVAAFDGQITEKQEMAVKSSGRALNQEYKEKLIHALNPDDDTMNFTKYEGKGIEVREMIDLCETMPFFADHRVVLVENSGFFKNKCDELADYMKELPDYLCLIFVENEVDKRNRMYKAVKAAGRIGEFVQQDEKTLMRWAAGLLKKEGKMITQRDMELLLTMTGVDMGNLRMELEKIISYTGDRDVVTGEDIQQVCTTQTQNKIFDMVRAVTEKNQKRALDLYYDLLTLKEPPMRILFLLAKQFRQLLLVKEYAEEGIPQPVMASRLGVPSFVVKNIAVCARSYRISELRQAVTDFVDAEEAVKTGRLQDVLSVELLIVKYSSARR